MADSEFDAVAAAKELDDMLGETSSDDREATNAEYISNLEAEIEELNAAAKKKDVQLAPANKRADQANAEIEAAGKRLATAASKELEQRTRQLLESFLPVVD